MAEQMALVRRERAQAHATAVAATAVAAATGGVTSRSNENGSIRNEGVQFTRYVYTSIYLSFCRSLYIYIYICIYMYGLARERGLPL